MAAERLSMRCVKEVLRQKWVLKKSNREVGRSLSISSGFVAVLGASSLTYAEATMSQKSHDFILRHVR